MIDSHPEPMTRDEWSTAQSKLHPASDPAVIRVCGFDSAEDRGFDSESECVAPTATPVVIRRLACVGGNWHSTDPEEQL